MNLKFSGKSQMGKKSKVNEDNYLLPQFNDTYGIDPDIKERGHLFLLCDGMGGNKAGEVASQLCCGWFFKEFYENLGKNINQKEWITEEISSINNRLFNLSNEYGEYTGMGTTLVSLLIRAEKAYIHNVGDSRLYLLRNNILQQITEDDSEVWKLYKDGYIQKDEIITNKRKHILTSAIATKLTPKIHEYDELEVKENDLFFLCSDGVTDVIIDSEIEQILIKDISLDKKIDTIINMAVQNKSKDDITVILVKIN